MVLANGTIRLSGAFLRKDPLTTEGNRQDAGMMRLAVSRGSAAFFAAKANWRFALMGMGYFVQRLHKVAPLSSHVCEPSGDGSERIPFRHFISR